MDPKKVVVDNDATEVDQKDAQTDDKSLDALLDEFSGDFDKGTKPPEKEGKAPSIDDSLENRLIALERKEFDTKVNTDIDSAADVFIDSLGDDMPFKVTRGFARSHLSDIASGDERFLNAFTNRKANPQGFVKVVKAAGRKFKEDLAPIDQQTSNDIDAVVTSIKGKQPTEVEDPNFDGWSDQRFNHWKQTGKDNPKL